MTFWELVAAVALGSALGYGMAVGAAGIIATLGRASAALVRKVLGIKSPSGIMQRKAIQEPLRFCRHCDVAVGRFDAHFCAGGKR